MKNLSLVLNVVLVIAVAVLFYLHFSSHKTATQTADAGSSNEAGTPAEAPKTPKVIKASRNYFVNMDTLNANYKLLLDAGKDLRARQRSLEANYQSQGQKYEQDLATYQQRVQEQTITADEAQRMEDGLRSLGQKIQNTERGLSQLAAELEEKNIAARDELDAFLEEYKKDKNIDYILGSSSMLPTVLYGNDSLDITDEVLKGLNDRYEAKKNQPKK